MNTKLRNKIEDFFLAHNIKFDQLTLIDTVSSFEDCFDQKKVDALEQEIERLETAAGDLQSQLERELEEMGEERRYYMQRCEELEQMVEELGGEVE